MEFVPLWTDILEGPCWKIVDLPAELYRFWTFCLMAAQRYNFADGYLPDERTLANFCQLSHDRDLCVTLRDRLVTHGLVDRIEGRDGPEYRMHDWDHWRAVKDRGAKERKRRQRARDKGDAEPSRNGHGSVTPTSQNVTHQITECRSQTSDIRVGRDTLQEASPEEVALLSRATERWGASSGDSIVSDLLRDYPADWVRVACDAEWDKHGAALNVAYLRGILRGYHRQGGPPKPAKSSGRVEKSQPATNGADLPHTPRVYRDDKPVPLAESMAIFNAHLKRGTA